MTFFRDIVYAEEAGDAGKLDLFLPDASGFPVFVYFHGGGLVAGGKSGERSMVEYLTAHGVAVVCADYRLFPQATYPDFLVDSAKAVAWTVKNIASYGGDGRVFVGGSSAGGYLSMMLCYDKHFLEDNGVTQDKISGYVHDAGQPTCHFNCLKARGIDPRRVIVDETAPLYHIGNEPEYRPALVIVSDNDMENRYEQTMLLLSTLKHFRYDTSRTKLVVMHGTHCAYVKAVDECGDSVFGKLVLDFIKEQSPSP